MDNSKDINLVRQIVKHCETIFSAQKRFGNDFKIFETDIDYFNSVCMSLLQIGEIANHLSENFIDQHHSMPWREIIGLRNVVVHGYGQLDTAIVWATLSEDMPKLHKYCQEII